MVTNYNILNMKELLIIIQGLLQLKINICHDEGRIIEKYKYISLKLRLEEIIKELNN